MEGTITLTINAVTLLTIAGAYLKMVTAISKLTVITEHHEKRLDRLEKAVAK